MKERVRKVAPFVGKKGWRERLDNILSRKIFGSALLGAVVGFEFTVLVAILTASLLLKAVIGLVAIFAVVLLLMYWHSIEDAVQDS